MVCLRLPVLAHPYSRLEVCGRRAREAGKDPSGSHEAVRYLPSTEASEATRVALHNYFRDCGLRLGC